MVKRIAAASIVIALVVSGAAVAASRSTGTVVKLYKTKSHGKVLATDKGRTLYLNIHDPKNKSNCGSTCVPYWPPLLTDGKPVAGRGVHKALLGRMRRHDGSWQVTYNGHPLYRYIGDTKPGQTNGY